MSCPQYPFIDRWERLSDDQLMILMSQHRSYRQAKQQHTATAEHLKETERDAEREQRKIEADPSTVDVVDYR